jgi:acetylornithine deacetylase/succinyl-diaminopimelate desuccinylase-like protein
VLAGGDLEVRLDEVEGPEQVNLVATKGLGHETPILLNSHLDTVPPGDPAEWTKSGGDPFAATVDGDSLYGLGSADAKLDALCKALALRSFDGRALRRGVIFAGTFGEERGLRGARALVARLPVRPAAAWVGEPTDLEPVTSHKGLLVVTITASDRHKPGLPLPTTLLVQRGRSAHSSTPRLGDNAIVRALRVARARKLRVVSIRGGDAANKVPALCHLEVAGEGGAEKVAGSSLTIERRSLSAPLATALLAFLHDLLAEQEAIVAASRRNPAFSPAWMTSNLGRLEAAGSRLEATLDFRCLPGDSSAATIERLRRFVDAAARLHGVDAVLVVERDNPPLETPPDSWIATTTARLLVGLALRSTPRTKAGCTEGGVYAAAGIPSIVIGPGRSTGNIHAPNEQVSVAALEHATEFYRRLIETACL